MNSAWKEEGIVFESSGNRLVGVIALPTEPATTGVLILVGGPQYRVGSHRQFTQLARDLAAAGIPSLRFDFTGMGDSEGERREFDETEPDITAAIEAFRERLPHVSNIVLWGLCDAASAAMIFAPRHADVATMVLLNPWVHGADYSPQVKLSHYYRPYLATGGNWKRLFSGKIRILPAIRDLSMSFVATLVGLLGIGRGSQSRQPFVRRMLDGLQRFEHDCLVILSEDDLTAREYLELVESDRDWKRAVNSPRVVTLKIDDADHTFSRRQWKDAVTQATIDWVRRH